jgi:hypothetical protein
MATSKSRKPIPARPPTNNNARGQGRYAKSPRLVTGQVTQTDQRPPAPAGAAPIPQRPAQGARR